MTTTRANGVENLPASLVISANMAIISFDTSKADLKNFRPITIVRCELKEKEEGEETEKKSDLLLRQLSREI